MSSSGSYDFVLTRDNIIKMAYQHIGLLGEGESLNSSQQTEGALLLNSIVKLRAADGMPLWALKRGTLLPTTGVSSVATNSHVVTTYDSTYLASAASSGAGTITVNAIGNIANGDQIGVELDSGDMQWTTVNGAPAGAVITLTATLTGDAAANNRVYAYTASADRVQRPLRIVEANLLHVSDDTSHTLEQIARGDYYALGSRASEGIPNQLYYEPSLGTNTADPATAASWYGTLYFYPRFNSGEYVIEFTYHRPFQDFDAAGDHPDFPQEFYLPLMLELAAILGPKAGVPIEERRALFAEAQLYREEALYTVVPETSLFIQPGE